MTNVAAERDAFEAWYAKRHPKPTHENSTWAHCAKMDDWEVWQARAGAAPAAVVCPAVALAKLRHLYLNMSSGSVRDKSSAKRIAEGLLAHAIAALEAAPQAPAAPALGRSAAQAVQALQEMWDDLEKSGSPRVNARAMRYYSEALSTVERALLAAPAAPSADDRAAYVAFLAGTFPQTYSKEKAEHWWDHGHVSALTWKAARAIVAAPAAPAVDASDTALLDALAAESMDLRCFDMPTGQGDADVGWRVIQHHMGEPVERVVSEVYKDDPRSAIRAGIARLERDPYCTGALHAEDAHDAAQAAAKGSA